MASPVGSQFCTALTLSQFNNSCLKVTYQHHSVIQQMFIQCLLRARHHAKYVININKGGREGTSISRALTLFFKFKTYNIYYLLSLVFDHSSFLITYQHMLILNFPNNQYLCMKAISYTDFYRTERAGYTLLPLFYLSLGCSQVLKNQRMTLAS